MFFRRVPPPQTLNICLVGQKIRVLSRKSDHGFVWSIARGLVQAGHKVTVISNRSPLGKSEILRDGVQTYYLQENLKYGRSRDFKRLVYDKFLELHGRDRFHIVHSLDDSAYLIAKNRRKHQVFTAFDVEATHLSEIYGILGLRKDTVRSHLTTSFSLVYRFLKSYFKYDQKLLSLADGMFVTNPQQRVALERYYLYPDYHIYQVPYGIDVGDLSPKEQSLELRKKLNLPEHASVVVTMSDMTDKREMLNVLLAFERVALKKPNSYLIMLGYGPAFKEIEFEMLSLALGSRVLMTGALNNEEILDYVLLGDVFVDLSSKSTGFEPTLIEAMAQKKIIIGSEVSPMINVVEDGFDGFLLRPADIESLSQLIIELLSGTLPIQEIGERAREKILNLFNSQKMISGVLQAYGHILERRGRVHFQKFLQMIERKA